MQQVKSIVKSPLILIALMLTKLITYYCLIDVSVLKNALVLGTIISMLVLFFELGSSEVRFKNIIFLVVYAGFTVLMFSDTMYFNYYHQTVSVKQLWQAANVAKVPKSFLATLIPASFILVIEVPLVFFYFRRYAKVWAQKYKISRKLLRRTRAWLVFAILLIAINPIGLKSFRKINSVEFLTNHINDVFYSVMDSISASSITPEEVIQQVEEIKETPAVTDRYQGIAKGKNLIVIQIESLQNFVIGATYNGQEITPNLNKLISDNSLYFNNYYANIGKGNTSDAEFSTLNSLYPVIDRECYSLYTENTYNGLPWLLRDEGYYAFAVHGYEGSFWNREAAYPYQGFQEFYSQEDLESDEIIGLGISDKSMFRQTVDLLKQQEGPYFSFIITLTNHHPYEMDEEYYSLELLEEDKGTPFGRYLETVRYTDEAIGEFIEQLKAEGLYEDTVIALYGDHHGLNATMDENYKSVTNFLGKDYDFDEMFNIPLIVHIPGSGITETVSTVGGQIDFLPTIANLFDIDIPQPYVLGRDLLNCNEGFVAFTVYLFEGSFVKNNVMFEVSREKLFEGSRAWDIETGEEYDIEEYYADYERALKLKDTSKYILEQDLMKDMFDHSEDIVLPEPSVEPTEEQNEESAQVPSVGETVDSLTEASGEE